MIVTSSPHSMGGLTPSCIDRSCHSEHRGAHYKSRSALYSYIFVERTRVAAPVASAPRHERLEGESIRERERKGRERERVEREREEGGREREKREGERVERRGRERERARERENVERERSIL